MQIVLGVSIIFWIFFFNHVFPFCRLSFAFDVKTQNVIIIKCEHFYLTSCDVFPAEIPDDQNYENDLFISLSILFLFSINHFKNFYILHWLKQTISYCWIKDNACKLKADYHFLKSDIYALCLSGLHGREHFSQYLSII